MLYHENSQHMRVMHLKYKSKYKHIKKQVKNLVLENAALADEVSQVQADLYAAREERRFLGKRLLRYGVEPVLDESANVEANSTLPNTTSEQTPNVPKKRGPKKRTASTAQKPEKKKPKGGRDKLKLDENLNSILIHTIGEIIPVNPNFHTAHAIYPVGYVATRVYCHPHDPRRKCVFTCKILNNAGKPQFQIIPDNDLDSVFFGETADICHQELLENIQRALVDIKTTMPLSLTVQGDKFFGLTNNMVKALLQMDTSFGLCAHFVGFPLPDPNFSIPEDKDPSLSFDALQRVICTPTATYHVMPEVNQVNAGDQPPDELLNFN